MAARGFSRALRLSRVAAPRSVMTAALPRPSLATVTPRVAPVMATRGIKTIDFAGTKEVVYEREDWPREKLHVSTIAAAAAAARPYPEQ